MFFKKFFVGVLLVFGLTYSSLYAVEGQKTLCVSEQQLDPQLSLEYLQYSSEQETITNDFAAEKAFFSTIVDTNGDLNQATLFSIIDNENPNFNISELKLAGSAKDKKFEDYMKAKIRYYNLKNSLLRIMGTTDIIIDEFNKGSKNTLIRQRLLSRSAEYTQLKIEKNQKISEEYKGTVEFLTGTYTWSEIGLTSKDLFESIIFPELDILFTKYKDAAKGMNALYDVSKLLYSNFANADAGTGQSLLIAHPGATLGVESANLVKSAIDYVSSDEADSEDQLRTINNSLKAIAENIATLKKVIDNNPGAMSNYFGAIAYITAINEDLAVLVQYKILQEDYLSNLNTYDSRIISLRRFGVMVNIAENISKLISLFPVTDSLEKYTTYVASGFTIFSTLSEELMDIVGVTNDETTNTFEAKRKYQAAVEQLAYIAYYDYKIKEDILRYGGERMKSIFVEKGYISTSSSCWDINLKAIDIYFNNLKPVPEKPLVTDTTKKPTINFILPQNATAIYPNLTAPQGKTVSFAPDYSAKRLTKCINDANISGIENNTYYHTDNADLEWKLGYVDDSTGIDGASIVLERDNGNGFSFASPKSSSMMLTDLYYGTPGKRDWHDCPWDEMSWESIVWDVDGGVDGNTSTSATHPLKHTGQTTSYVVGDDAYYHAGKLVHYSRDDATQIVTDHITGLEWQDDIEVKTNWADANTYCTSKGNGWRLPTIEELNTIVDYSHNSPSIDPTFQNSQSNNYWSSTTYAGSSYGAWVVYFNRGHQYGYAKSYSNSVRCVRAGQ